MTYPWLNFAVALALGLLIGLERERSKGEGPARGPAGIRTFALAALLGAIGIHLGDVLLLVIVEGGVAVLAAVSYFRDRDSDPGLTTEVGLMAAPLIGGLAMSDTLLASGLGVAVAVVFAVKEPLHSFVKGALTDAEVNDGLVLAVATFVIWPQLPDRYLGPLQAINPHSLWLLVVLMLSIGACGHAATRAVGPRFGLSIAGLASGFISSTATIGSMAGRAVKDPASMGAAVAGAAFSTVSTFLQLALLLFAVSKPTLVLMAPALAAGAVAAAIYGLAFALRGRAPDHVSAPEQGRAFSVWTAFALVGADRYYVDRRRRLEGLAGRSWDHRWRRRRRDSGHPFIRDLCRFARGLRKTDAAGRPVSDPCSHDQQRAGEDGDSHRCGLWRLRDPNYTGPSFIDGGGMGCCGGDAALNRGSSSAQLRLSQLTLRGSRRYCVSPRGNLWHDFVNRLSNSVRRLSLIFTQPFPPDREKNGQN